MELNKLEELILSCKYYGMSYEIVVHNLGNPVFGRKFSREEVEVAYRKLQDESLIDTNGALTKKGNQMRNRDIICLP